MSIARRQMKNILDLNRFTEGIMKTKRRTAAVLGLVALAVLFTPTMRTYTQTRTNIPRLLNDQEERELTARIKQEVQRSAPRLRALDERSQAIRRENPNLPAARPKPPEADTGELPRRFTWEHHGGVTEVKDQRPAGTCWSFARIGALEAAYLLRYGNAFNLAEQDLLDCGRDGADDRLQEGVRFDSQNPYQKQDAKQEPTPACKHNHTPFSILGNRYATPGTENQPDDLALRQPVPVKDLKNAVLNHGPAVVAMHIPNESAISGHHGTGVFKETIPLTYKPGSYGSHIVLIVGWDEDKGAWRMKNSWGTDWGDNGFGWIAYGSNKIGMGAYTYTLNSPDLLTSSIWEKSNAEEYEVDGWPYPYYDLKNNELSKQGWRVCQLQAGVSEGQVLYSAVWRKSQDEEVQHHGLKLNDFQKKYNELWKQGWRIRLLANYVLDGEVYYTAVWRKGSGEEAQYYGLRFEEFQKKYDELWKQGLRLEILSNVVKDGKVLYFGVWRKGTDGETQFYGLDYTQFQKKYDELWKDGWRVHLLQNYRMGHKIYFNATWRKGQAGEMQWYGLEPREFGHKAQEMRKEGWRVRLLDIY